MKGSAIVIDAADPDVSIAWDAADDVEGVSGSYDDNGHVYFTVESPATQADIQASATIEVSDYNLNAAPTLSTASSTADVVGSPAFGEATLKNGKVCYQATVTFKGVGTAQLAINAQDWSERAAAKNESVELAVDDATPTMQVAWNDAATETVDGRAYYAAARTATVKLVDDLALDLSDLSITAPGATQSGDDLIAAAKTALASDKKSCTFTVTYSSNALDADDPDKLVVSGVKDAAGHEAVGTEDDLSTADVDEGTTVTNGAYESDEFLMLVNPIVSVTASPSTASATSNGSNYYQGSLTLTVSVRELPQVFATTAPVISGDGRDAEKSGSTWTADVSNELVHTTEILYKTEGTASQLVVTAAGTPKRQIVVSGTDNTPKDSYSFDTAGFYMDLANPTLEVTFAEDAGVTATDVTEGGKTIPYYSGKRTATVKITEANFVPGNISIQSVGGSITMDAVDDTKVKWDTSGDVHTATVIYDKNFVGQACQLVVSGTDAAGRALVDAADDTKTYTEDDPYEADQFKVLANPVLAVSLPEGVAKDAYEADENGVVYLAGDPLDITFTVTDADWSTHEAAISVKVKKDGTETTVTPTWSSEAGSLTHVGVVQLGPGSYEDLTFDSTDASFAVRAAGSEEAYAAPTQQYILGLTVQGASPTGKFAIDGEKPVLQVSITSGGQTVEPKVVADAAAKQLETRYFDADAEALVTIKVSDDTSFAFDAATQACTNITASVQGPTETTQVVLTAVDGSGDKSLEGTFTLPANAADGAYVLTIKGTDRSCNAFETDDGKVDAATKAALVEDAGTHEVKYETRLVKDAMAPVVSLSFDNPRHMADQGTGTEVYYFNPSNADADATATITVSDANVDISSLKFDGTATDATIVEDGDGVVWHPADGAPGAYEAKVVFPVHDVAADKDFTLRLTGADMTGLKLVAVEDANNDPVAYVDDGVLSSTVRVVASRPSLSVTYAPTPGQANISKKATQDEVVSFDADANGAVTATVTVSGKYLDPTLLTVKLDGIDASPTWTSETNGAESTLTADVSVTATAADTARDDHVLAVSGANLGDMALESADTATWYVDEASGFATTVRFDTQKPQLEVRWTIDSDVRNGSYYKEDRAATVTITDPNFDKSCVKVLVDGAQESAEPSSTSTDASGSTVLTYEVAFDTEGVHSLRIEGSDFAGNVLEGGDKAPVKHIAVNADADGVYDTGEFTIDKTQPKVTITSSQKVQVFKQTAYFGEAATLEFVASVDEGSATFDPSTTNKDVNGDEIAGETTDIQIDANPIAAPSYNIGAWMPATDGKSTSYTISFTLDPSQAQMHMTGSFTVIAYDLAGNSTVYSFGNASNNDNNSSSTVDKNGSAITADDFALDIQAPTITYENVTTQDIADRSYSGNYSNSYLFYNGATKLKIRVSDNLGVFSLSATGGNSAYAFANDESKQGETTRTVEITLREAIEFASAFQLHAVDCAGNDRVWRISPREGMVHDVTGSSNVNTPLYAKMANLYPQALIQDTTVPQLAFSGAEAGVYYNDARTVRLDVVERNFRYSRQFDAGQVIVTGTKKEGNASRAESSLADIAVGSFQPTTSGQSPDGFDGNYYVQTALADDGHYALSAKYTDPAGNAMQAAIGEFTVDRTAPTVSVTYDNNNAVNGMYYPAARTATVVITEHNFNPSDFTIDTTGSVGSWSDDGDVHTTTVSFGSDGRYAMTIAGHDMAGNELATYTESEFVIDMTAPSVTFAGVDDGSAYNGIVTPSILFSDEANFDTSGTSYTLTGTKNGSVQYSASEQAGDNSSTVEFSDFGFAGEDSYDPAVDDIYTIQANLTDMAGNSADGSVTFSVNRFGSNYRIVDAESYERNDGYLAEPQDVFVQEVNVSGCEPDLQTVTVTAGTKVSTLARSEGNSDTGFALEEQASDSDDSRGWSLYTYRVKAGNFDTDGRYHVAVSSDDRATNKNTSSNYFDRGQGKTADAEVSFILDTTDPVITGLNLENGATYGEDPYKATFSVVENLGVKNVEVTLDGQSVTPEDDGYGNYSLEIGAEPFTARNVSVTAYDLANRSDEASAISFHVTTDVLELHLPLVIGGGMVVVAIVGVATYFVLVVRRREV